MSEKSDKNDLYVPFGPEWEKDMMQFTKIELIRMLADHFYEYTLSENLRKDKNDG